MDSNEFVRTAKRIIKEKPEIFEALLEFERTKKLPKIHYRKRLNITIRDDILRDFRRYCVANHVNMSKFVENCMKQMMKR